MRITDIKLVELVGQLAGPAVDSFRHTSRAMPPDVYSYRESRATLRDTKVAGAGTAAMHEIYLTIETDEGAEGFFGPVDYEAAVVIERKLKPILIGEDPMSGALLWDKMYRSNRHSRTGHFMFAVGTVDNALWDLRGKVLGAPVYRLLGGNANPVIEAYVSTIGFSHDRDAIREQALALRAEGFRKQKWFMASGPADGAEGLNANVALVRDLREALGDDAEIMFDASMSWDVEYTLRWAHRVAEYNPRWIEEPLSPDKMEAWQALAARSPVPVAGGEHIYTKWEMLRFLQAGALSVLQPDPEWCGGVTALQQICVLGDLYDVPVIPHGHGLRAAVHVVAAQSPGICPMGEFVARTMRRRYAFEAEPPFPVDGHFRLSDRPGFGIVIDESRVEDRRSFWIPEAA